MILYNNDILHERVVEHLKKNGVEVPYVLARNILFMCDEALRDAPENKLSNNKYTATQATPKSCPKCGSESILKNERHNHYGCLKCCHEWA